MSERIFLTPPKTLLYSTSPLKQGVFLSVRDDFTVNKRYYRNRLLIIPKGEFCFNQIEPIPSDIWKEWGYLIQWTISHYKMKGGAIVISFGDTKRSGSPVPFIHTTIHEPNGSGPVNAVFVAGNTMPLIPTDYTQNEALGDIQAAARSRKYHAHMKKTVGEGICPFCDKNAKEKTCIKDGKFWWIKPNDFPYRRHAHHLIMVLKGKHSSKENDISNICPESWTEFGKIIQWAVQKYSILGGGIVLRFGLRKYNASTLTHVHAHIQAPDLTNDNGTTVARAVICKG